MFSYLKNKIFIIVFHFVIVGLLFPQEQNKKYILDAPTELVQTENLQKYKLKLTPRIKTKSPLLSLTKTFDPFVESFEFIVPDYIKNESKKPLNYIERQRIKNEINQAMKVYRDGKLKNDLGIVGQVLGYSQTAAVLGLAIYHLHKYGFK